MKQFNRILMAAVVVCLVVGCKSTYKSTYIYLDSSDSARREGWQFIQHTTRSNYVAFQGEYRPETFDAWSKKLALLQPGMTEEEIRQILNPKKLVHEGLIDRAGRVDFIILDNAYFTAVMVSTYTGRMSWVIQHPIAIAYEIRADRSER